MPSPRSALGAAAVLAAVAAPAFAQTSGTGGYNAAASSAATGAGAMQTPSTGATPYAPPPITGGAPQPSAASGGMAGASPSFTPLRVVPGANIIATLQASGEFTRLLAALQATNLTGLVSANPHLTLFAPTDAAFAKLPPGQLDQLMKSPQQLQNILAYHLVNAVIKPDDVLGHAAGKVAAANQKELTLDGSSGAIKVDTATVLQPGVTASNGIIYPIDTVLTPPAT